MNPLNRTEVPGFPDRRIIRTLVVDDSPLLREFLAVFISRESGFELAGTATDGWQALQCVATLQPDLILMDVDMPLLDGITAMRRIKQSGHPPVIVIVTSDNSQECRARAEDAGADGFVSKSEHLQAELKSALDNLFSRNRQFLPGCCRATAVSIPGGAGKF